MTHGEAPLITPAWDRALGVPPPLRVPLRPALPGCRAESWGRPASGTRRGRGGGRRRPPPRPAPPGTRCCPGAQAARLLRGAAAQRFPAPAPRAREPTRRAAGCPGRRPAAAEAAGGRSRWVPLPPKEFLSRRRTRPRKRPARTRRPPQELESKRRGRRSRGAPAPAPRKLSPPFPSRAQSAIRGAAGALRGLSASGGTRRLPVSGSLSRSLPGCGEPRRRLHGRGAVARAWRQVGSCPSPAAEGGSRARGHASSGWCSALHNPPALRPSRRDCGFSSKTCLRGRTRPAEETGSPGSQWQGGRAGGRRLWSPGQPRRQVGGAGLRCRLAGPIRGLGLAGPGRGAGPVEDAEGSPESEPKAGTPNLPEEWLAVLGTPGGDG